MAKKPRVIIFSTALLLLSRRRIASAFAPPVSTASAARLTTEFGTFLNTRLYSSSSSPSSDDGDAPADGRRIENDDPLDSLVAYPPHSHSRSSSPYAEEDYESYNRCLLTPREERRAVESETGRYAIIDADAPAWRSALKSPWRKAKRAARRVARAARRADGATNEVGEDKQGRKSGSRTGMRARGTKPGALILLRCGESEWNANQTFTGWADPKLTPRGHAECEHAGRLLLAEGYDPDVVFTSRLKRGYDSVWTILRTIDALYLPVYKTWRLNERAYGALTGLSKRETAKRLGSDVVQAWRNSLKARPPPLKKTDPHYPGNDPRYSDLENHPTLRIPLTESLSDCMDRARPLWEYKIREEIRDGNTVLVVAHANTLRGLIKVIDGIGDREIQDVSMPTGIPFVYKFDRRTLSPLLPPGGSLMQVHASGVFLEKPGLLKEALRRQEEWESYVPGFGSKEKVIPGMRRVTNLEESLLKLREEQEAERWVLEHGGVGGRKDGLKLVGGSGVRTVASGEKAAEQHKLRFTDDPSEFETFDDVNDDNRGGIEASYSLNVQPLPPQQEEEDDSSTSTAPSTTTSSGSLFTTNDDEDDEGPVVVLIRHGRTPHNNMGLFTGWEDPPLAPDGIDDAKNAGKLLRRHGYEFDVCYSSWLSRAIETAWYVLDELDLNWIPLVKSWRLNERMYGALTGKSKKMIANEYGEDQLVKWRRGFTIRPPPTSSYSLSYPGNDYRRTKYVKDIRISLRETLFRSIEQRKFTLHRKFPKTESLKNCMDRSIPFYTQRIYKEAVEKGKRVLITSHENAIRGILMYLCDIPPEAMNQLHLPNGLPLVYSVKGRCISLLDDGSGKDPMEVHDFGPAAKYLFKPCDLTDEFFEEMEKRGAMAEAAEAQQKEKQEVVISA